MIAVSVPRQLACWRDSRDQAVCLPRRFHTAEPPPIGLRSYRIDARRSPADNPGFAAASRATEPSGSCERGYGLFAVENSRNGPQQRGAADRFKEICPRAGRHASRSQVRLVVTGDDDDRKLRLMVCDPLHQVQPGHVRHVQVENEAIRRTDLSSLEKFPSGGVDIGLEPRRAQQASERPPNGLVIIDYGDESSMRHQRTDSRLPFRPT